MVSGWGDQATRGNRVIIRGVDFIVWTCADPPHTCVVQPHACVVQPHTCVDQPHTCVDQGKGWGQGEARGVRWLPLGGEGTMKSTPLIITLFSPVA